MISEPIEEPTHRYTDKEIMALRDEVRDLGERLEEVLDTLLDKVTARLLESGISDDGALAAVKSLRNDDSGVGGGGPDDYREVEPGE